jgi:hypothetical protein
MWLAFLALGEWAISIFPHHFATGIFVYSPERKLHNSHNVIPVIGIATKETSVENARTNSTEARFRQALRWGRQDELVGD